MESCQVLEQLLGIQAVPDPAGPRELLTAFCFKLGWVGVRHMHTGAQRGVGAQARIGAAKGGLGARVHQCWVMIGNFGGTTSES